ncbi:MAG: hypothetical protein ACK5ZX_08225 [Bacteroidota bacterium]
MGDLTVICHAMGMGNLTVACNENGGAIPLCDVALSQTYQNNRHLVVGGNYARSSRVFESGFTGFRRLTITSLVWVRRLLLNGAFIFGLFAYA